MSNVGKLPDSLLHTRLGLPWCRSITCFISSISSSIQVLQNSFSPVGVVTQSCAPCTFLPIRQRSTKRPWIWEPFWGKLWWAELFPLPVLDAGAYNSTPAPPFCVADIFTSLSFAQNATTINLSHSGSWFPIFISQNVNLFNCSLQETGNRWDFQYKSFTQCLKKSVISLKKIKTWNKFSRLHEKEGDLWNEARPKQTFGQIWIKTFKLFVFFSGFWFPNEDNGCWQQWKWTSSLPACGPV